jgi:hypothetical protein
MPRSSAQQLSRRPLSRRLPFGAALALAALGALALVAYPSDAASGDRSSEVQALTTMSGEGYTVTVEDASGAVGDPAAIVVVIKATGQHKVNVKYPHKLKLAEPPAGLELPKRTLKRADGQLDDEKTFTFSIPAKATRAGSFTVSGKLKFSVCDATSCLIKKEAVQATVTAK